MTRADELRKKFAAKGQAAINEVTDKKSDFIDRLNEILLVEKNAKATSKIFVDKLYHKFEAEHPSDVGAWISQIISDTFLSAKNRPVWVFEPRWCFDSVGQPLEFLHQFEDDEGVSFYVFRGYKDASVSGISGKVRYLRLEAQDDDGIIQLEGEITG